MKILEAMSIGVPFVTTTVGAEGIPVTDGVDSVIADTPEAYVSGIQKLEDAETRKMMVENGRKLLLSNYSFEKFKTDRIEIVKALLS
jgi:glycosyltransferase involved in cell wall biosynthesis